MNNPPNSETMRPGIDIPPFVPLGTFFLVVIRKGSPVDKTVPSSLAHVSPFEHAKAPEKVGNRFEVLQGHGLYFKTYSLQRFEARSIYKVV